MRNLTTTSVIIEHPTGARTFVEPSKQRLDLPDLYEEQDTGLRIGPKQRPIRVRKQARCGPEERERLNADLRRHVNEDRDQTGDGIVLVDQHVLPLVDHYLRNSVFTPEPAVSALRSSPIVRCLIGAGNLP
ncbi:MAG: hypothetical protein OXG72_12690 [Acidobacteria bacterium]|nr:hypothetical protein [Acidobacteriota bacterium]